MVRQRQQVRTSRPLYFLEPGLARRLEKEILTGSPLW